VILNDLICGKVCRPFLKIRERHPRQSVSCKDLLSTGGCLLINSLPIANHEYFLPRAFLSHFLHLRESSGINVEELEVYISEHGCQFRERVLLYEIQFGLLFLSILATVLRHVALRGCLALAHLLILQVVEIVVLCGFPRVGSHFVHSFQIVINCLFL